MVLFSRTSLVGAGLLAALSVALTGLSPGASATFSNVKAGSSLDVVYCTMNNPTQLTLYINGTKSQSISSPTTGSWSTTYATKKVTVTIPQGATLKLQVDAGDAGANLDFIQIN